MSLCECGCRQPAPIATYSHAARGWVKGKPKRYISGHNAGVHWTERFVYAPSKSGCWLWRGYRDPAGYGRINIGKIPALAHRVIYEHVYGGSPPALHHRCGVRCCVNPEHLQETTYSEHPRLDQEMRTHCRRGHAYAEHGRWHTGKTARYCSECERQNARRRRVSA
jgi:hypothetical protein